jgi:predicted transcriptional regulator
MVSLDGKTSMREIARKTGKGSVTVSKALYGFMEAGLAVEVEAPSAVQDAEPAQPQRRSFLGLWSRR